MSRQCTHYGRWPQHGFTSLKKLRPQSVTSRIQPGSDVIVCAEMDEQWGYVGAKSRQRWLLRHNLNLRQHLARLGRKSLSFSKSVELHDKVIGHYLNIKHYQ
ncbi:putative transposase [Shigella dysenteriae 225-75]|nr:putative transposase [Shigella dysenteriae 225-75]